MSIAFMSAMLCFGLSACSSNDGVTEPENIPAKEYIVSIGFKGEITISEAPLSRATGNDLYGIQVFSCPKNETADNYTAYAYGLFDDLSAMTIKLIDGYKYKFVATMVVDGKANIYQHGKEKYGYPFYLYSTAATLNNKFEFSNIESFSGFIEYGQAEIKGLNNSRLYYGIPNLDRYYGEYIDYIPSENGNVSIDMLRTVFGLKVIANNLTEGTIKIAMTDAPEMTITHSVTEVEDIFTFCYVDKAYSNENYSESISTNFTWTKADGATIPLGTHNVTFKRNKQTIVTIEMDKAINDASSNQTLSLSLESNNMAEGDKYTIEGEKITNNTVAPGTGE